ncbi:MAG: SGNH/GDSL hydrolase family protein, partial [Anaerolineae bacterium]|nr:SGNH/GDSL hydrolase family protein [Anaerolineae bacterium]
MRKILMLLVLSFSALAFQGNDIDLTPPELGEFDPASVSDIDISAYPLLPEVTDHAREIYQAGIAQGNQPQVFSKVGDCMTAAEYFLTPFGLNDYALGEYEDLQEVVDYFNSQPVREGDWELDSFANPGLATASGFNTASVLDSIWSNPDWCEANESPLSCEYRVSKPIFSLIMFGTNDTFFIEADAFDYYLRLIVLETIQKNIVPVLYTFPTRPEYPEKSDLFNQIIIKIAEDYDLPLVNLWLGLQDLPNGGVDEIETIHLTIPADGTSTGVFDESTLQTGYTYRNLVTLQA